MLKSCKVLGLLTVIAVVGGSPVPQERRKNAKESPGEFMMFALTVCEFRSRSSWWCVEEIVYEVRA